RVNAPRLVSLAPGLLPDPHGAARVLLDPGGDVESFDAGARAERAAGLDVNGAARSVDRHRGNAGPRAIDIATGAPPRLSHFLKRGQSNFSETNTSALTGNL